MDGWMITNMASTLSIRHLVHRTALIVFFFLQDELHVLDVYKRERETDDVLQRPCQKVSHAQVGNSLCSSDLYRRPSGELILQRGLLLRFARKQANAERTVHTDACSVREENT